MPEPSAEIIEKVAKQFCILCKVGRKLSPRNPSLHCDDNGNRAGYCTARRDQMARVLERQLGNFKGGIMETNQALCELCGEPMPEGEAMFKYHGYSGPCPKPPKVECGQKQRDMELLRNTQSDIVYYGPHPCDVCGKMICRVSLEQGGMKFDYPKGIIYPNTNWVQHLCPPSGPASVGTGA